jgi:hypothetical protein
MTCVLQLVRRFPAGIARGYIVEFNDQPVKSVKTALKRDVARR